MQQIQPYNKCSHPYCYTQAQHHFRIPTVNFQLNTYKQQTIKHQDLFQVSLYFQLYLLLLPTALSNGLPVYFLHKENFPDKRFLQMHKKQVCMTCRLALNTWQRPCPLHLSHLSLLKKHNMNHLQPMLSPQRRLMSHQFSANSDLPLFLRR